MNSKSVSEFQNVLLFQRGAVMKTTVANLLFQYTCHAPSTNTSSLCSEYIWTFIAHLDSTWLREIYKVVKKI